MDITTQRVVDTAPMHVKSAAGAPLYDDGKPVRIVFFGPGSRQFAEIESRQTARAIKRMHDNDGKVAAPTAEDRRKEVAEDLAAVTAGFENLSHGELVGAELHEAVFADQKLGFIVAQAQKFLADWGNFKPGSAGN